MSDTLTALREMVAKLPDAPITELDAGIQHYKRFKRQKELPGEEGWPVSNGASGMFFEHGPCLLSIFEPKSGSWTVNKTWNRVLGWSHDELMARRADLVHPDDRKKVTAHRDRMKDQGYSGGVSLRYRHKEGHYITLWWYCRLVNGFIYGTGTPEPTDG